MPVIIRRATKTGFCFGVRRAIEMIENAARERGGLDTLGAVVHNQQVVRQLEKLGVRVINDIDEIGNKTVAVSSHGVSPKRFDDIKNRQADVIDTTCPFVHRAQLAARKLAQSGFYVVIFGEAEHPEVKGILGWAGNLGMATLDEKQVAQLEPMPRKLGILSQTTQMPAHFVKFAQSLLNMGYCRDSEIYIIDTICHDIRDRQEAAIELAIRSDLMLVVGGRNSANTNHLAQLCARITETRLIERASEIEDAWLENKKHVGVISGSSTPDQTIDEVIARLEEITGSVAD